MQALKVVESPEYTYEDSIEDLRGIVWNSVKETGKDWATLAADANLAKSTVSRFAYGETKRPAHNTVFALERAVGLRSARVRLDAPRQRDELWRSRFVSRSRPRTRSKASGRCAAPSVACGARRSARRYDAIGRPRKRPPFCLVAYGKGIYRYAAVLAEGIREVCGIRVVSVFIGNGTLAISSFNTCYVECAAQHLWLGGKR